MRPGSDPYPHRTTIRPIFFSTGFHRIHWSLPDFSHRLFFTLTLPPAPSSGVQVYCPDAASPTFHPKTANVDFRQSEGDLCEASV
ncbi:hypothetical protein LXL04_003024 [Taraxacum kok-saghyz]